MLAYWYDFLYFGRGLTIIMILAVTSIVRIVKRGRASSTPQQFQQGFPQQPPPPLGAPGAPVSPFAGPVSQPLAPNPLDPPAERPRSTPLPGIFGSDPPPPPPR